jgi:hypothetical protein
MVRIDARFSFLSHACTSGAGSPNRGPMHEGDRPNTGRWKSDGSGERGA